MDLSIQNPWWQNPRAIEDDEKVKSALENSPALIRKLSTKKNLLLLGPRQVGKTTAIKLTIRDLLKDTNPREILYFSCEPLNNKNDIIDLITEYDRISKADSRKYIFLDEVTQIKDWELAIKYLIESPIGKNKTLIATGSNAMLLKKGSERLPGRNIDTLLFLPLGFREYLLHFGSSELKKNLEIIPVNDLDINALQSGASIMIPFLGEINSKLHTFLKTGGYPKAIYEYLKKEKISAETYEIYVKWILGDLSRYDRKESIFKSMVRGIVKNYTSKFSLLSYSKEMEIPSHATVADYLELLQSLLLINNLYQVDLAKSLPVFRKERKSYFMDPFFYSVFKGYIMGRYDDYSDSNESMIMEGVVCEALARLKRRDLDISNSLWFFSGKKETDFVLNNKDLIGIELKWQEKVKPSDFSNFYSFKKRILLSKKDFSAGDVLILPAGIFLAML